LEVQNAFFTAFIITKILGFDFLYGDPATALREPFAVGLGELTIALLIVSSQTIKAALYNPVEAILQE
jgi:hypothetical protein